ncbi:flavin-containing monooxygenase [Microbacterium aurantiacum]|uniref:NAD(P)/FAD-dependent oxidoreductase n=1 Tax=Microbacterium aurantiacum TaxID=162393 RepID=A0ABT8FVW3_9MICO|nr:NAD(P)/FAD-dependent oxidoreductase [Microbacterium aurantiacum]MDN4465360.1 NAD(P)/FAD-dependent oxidoreductase [Microbacterium aurantiacum]
MSADAVIVGAGFAGLYALYKLRGLGLETVAIERGEGVGGTWYWNRYPGARCDIESAYYSYSFSDELQDEWDWTEKYATQPEILAYLQHVADRFDLVRDIRFAEEVLSAEYDEASARWRVTTTKARIDCRFVVFATGCLSVPKSPEIPGLADFAGDLLRTHEWPTHVPDLAGRRVGLIGTGSSGIQVAPLLAEQAGHLTVFQRTANFSVPAHNAPLDPVEWARTKGNYRALRERSRWSASGSVPLDIEPVPALSVSEQERTSRYEERWRIGGMKFLQVFGDIYTDRAANDTAADFVRAKIADIVEDPRVARMLMPTDHPIGTKRICTDTDYYRMFNRPDVALVDVRDDPIVRIDVNGVVTDSGPHPLDVLVLATGFDAMTGALLKIDIRGRDGTRLRDHWSEGPVSYLGIAISGFPNLFMITGPGSPSVISNMVTSIEQHVDWIAEHIRFLDTHAVAASEALPDAELEWVAHVRDQAEATLYGEAASWYVGANVPGKPRVFMPYVGGVGTYRARCDEIAAEGYRGFALRSSADVSP